MEPAHEHTPPAMLHPELLAARRSRSHRPRRPSPRSRRGSLEAAAVAARAAAARRQGPRQSADRPGRRPPRASSPRPSTRRCTTSGCGICGRSATARCTASPNGRSCARSPRRSRSTRSPISTSISSSSRPMRDRTASTCIGRATPPSTTRSSTASLRDHGAKSLIKSKSMLTEECGFRHYMASVGIEVDRNRSRRAHPAARQ